jgi:DNA-binding beta-propeller fold protein YncE
MKHILLFASVACAVTTLSAQSGVPRNDLPQTYRTTRDWAELPPSMHAWPAVTAVEPAPDGSIYVVERCADNSCTGRPEPPILKYSPEGKLIKAWGEGMFNFPHGAAVDRDGNLWVTDARAQNGKGNVAIKFDQNGRVLMTLGKPGVSGSGPDEFDQPCDVLVAPNGDIFVADSHRNGKNNRIVKFSKDGKFIKEWGHKGSGPGEISEPHTIAMDSQGRLFVGDRENNRIQIFDQDGRYITEWRQFGRPSGIFITPDDTMYVADSESGPDTGAHELPGIKKGIRIGSAKDGTVRTFIEDMESTRPDHSGAEGLGVDRAGNVYGAVVRRQMLERHVPMAAAGQVANQTSQMVIRPILDNDRVNVIETHGDSKARPTPREFDTVVVCVDCPNGIGASFEPKGSSRRTPASARTIEIALKDHPVAPLANKSGYPNAFPRPRVKKILDNGRVLVWDYTWNPGEPTPMHYHDKDVVVVYLAEGALRSTDPKGESTLNEHYFGFTKFNARDRAHTEELVKGQGRAIIVELK